MHLIAFGCSELELKGYGPEIVFVQNKFSGDIT
jgi:hypothetical protein